MKRAAGWSGGTVETHQCTLLCQWHDECSHEPYRASPRERFTHWARLLRGWSRTNTACDVGTVCGLGLDRTNRPPEKAGLAIPGLRVVPRVAAARKNAERHRTAAVPLRVTWFVATLGDQSWRMNITRSFLSSLA